MPGCDHRIDRVRGWRAALLATLLATAACSAPPRASLDDEAIRSHLRLAGEALSRGDPAAATRHVDLALTRIDANDQPQLLVDALTRRAAIHLDQDHADAALADLDAAIERAADNHYADGQLTGLIARARLHAHRGALPAAQRDLELATPLADRIGTWDALAPARYAAAELRAAAGEPTAALALANEAARLYSLLPPTAEHRACLAACHFLLADTRLRQEDPRAAILEFRRARDLAAEVGDRPLQVRSIEGMAQALLEAGHAEDARIRFEQAVSAWHLLGDDQRARLTLATLIRLSQAHGREDRLAHYRSQLEGLAAEPADVPDAADHGT